MEAWYPIGRPNTTRSLQYWTARRIAARAEASASDAIAPAQGSARSSRYLKPCPLPDSVGLRHLERVDEQIVGGDRLAAHLGARADATFSMIQS